MKIRRPLAVVLLAAGLAMAPAWAQEADTPAPPDWIQGAWQYTELDEYIYVIVFTNDDIFFDGDSTAGFIEDETISVFTQTTTDAAYEIYLKYSDGYWWWETFMRPNGDSMKSSFITSDGESNTENYTRAE
jgi:hypothetical protein